MAHHLTSKILKVFGWVIISIVALVVLLTAALYIPAVQTWVKDFALDKVNSSTGMNISAGRFRLKFPLDISLGDVCVIEQSGDTMATLGNLSLSVRLLPLLKGDIDIDGADARQLYYAMGTPDSAMMLRARINDFSLSEANLNFAKGNIGLGDAEVSGADVTLLFNDSVSAPVDTTTSESSPLRITAGKITLADVTYRMRMMPVIDSLSASVPAAMLSNAVVDMGSRRIHASSLSVDSVSATYLTPDSAYIAAHPADGVDSVAVASPSGDMWTVTADRITLSGKNATYAMRGAEPMPGLDFNYLQASDIEIAVDSFFNCGPAITVPLRTLKARERSGIALSADGRFSMDSTLMRASGFNISTLFSHLKLDAAMGMGDLASNSTLPLSLSALGSIASADIALAFPALAPMLRSIPSPEIALNADIKGTSGKLNINDLSAKMAGFASLQADGSVSNPFDFNSMAGRVNIDGSFSNLNSLKPTILEAKMAKEINIPAMTLKGQVNYNPGVIDGNLALTTSGGRMAMKAAWKEKQQGYHADIDLDKFPVKAFMPALGLGDITATLQADGSGLNLADPRTRSDINLNIESADYLNRIYSNITAQVQLQDSHAVGSLVSNNNDADLDFDFTADFSKQGYDWTIDGQIHHIDLRVLQLSPQVNSGSVALRTTGFISTDASTINATATIHSLDWDIADKRIYADSANIEFATNDSSLTATVSSGDLIARVASPASLDSLLARFTATSVVIDSVIAHKNIDVAQLQRALPQISVELSSGQSNFVADYLAQNGIAFKNASIEFHNDSLINLSANLLAFKTGDTRIDTISFGAVQHGKFLAYKGAVNNRPGTFDQFAHVNLTGFVADHRLAMLLSQKNIQGERGFLLGLNADMTDSVATVKFVPYTPTIGYKKWQLNKDNFLSYNFSTRHIDANLALANEKSYLKVFTEHKEGHSDEQEDLIVQISDIQIQDWLAISPYAPPMKGNLGADMRIHWNREQLTGNGTVSLNDLYYGRDKVGSFDIGVDVAAESSGRLRADASLLVDSVKVITANGVLNDTASANPFLLDFSMIHFPLRVLNPFLPKEYASLSGMLNGQMDITGSLVKPVFNGFLDFDSTAVSVGMLGTVFKFSENKIPVDSSVVHFNDFAISAINENPLRVNGTVDLRELTAMKLNLDLNASNMQIVNSTRPKKADVYGKAFIDVDTKVRGGMSLLFVDAKLKLRAPSNITYVMSDAQSALASQSTGDMVKFVQFADTAAVVQADSITSSSMALSLDAELTIAQGTTINVDLSPDGKNKVSVLGQGELDFSMSPFNDMRLTGRYNINGGFVRYTPPLMSEKLFNFKEGSFISFTGDMLNPILNIQAVDKLKANVTQQGQNSRLINFDVLLSVTNTLQNMNVAFDLSTTDDITVENELSSMSPDQRANQAMNLLLYNVYTGPGTKASSSLGGNPLYSFLESQINSWAANNIRGVDISFGIDQYDKTTDGVSQQTTSYSYRVSKTLFNDRFKIIVGGNYSTDANSDENFSQNLINDIAFEYMLNRSGSMYVRLFRHTGYESILEGEITQTGVGFVLRRKVNSLKDLFRWVGRLKNSISGKNKAAAVEDTANTHTPNQK